MIGISKQKAANRLSIRENRPDTGANFYVDPESRFTIVASDPRALEKLLTADIFSVAEAFVNGEFIVQGDIFSAIHFFRARSHPSFAQWWFTLAAKLQSAATNQFAGKRSARHNIQFHYDRSNEFYRQFLDSRMVYSAAYFERPDANLEDAQLEKLDRICRSLELRAGQRFLDIGCGWGALVIYAAAAFRVHAVGCTLSRNQFEYARNLVREKGLENRVIILEADYRNLLGRFDRIASVGMFEHVGLSHLGEYFRKVNALLEDDGRLLNSGIVRPETVSDDPETLFVQKSVFPGGQLVHLADIFRQAERAGLHALAMEDWRQHYALTCRAWVARLQANAQSCLNLVDEVTYRTWLLYLAGSALSFEDGHLDLTQLTFAKAHFS